MASNWPDTDILVQNTQGLKEEEKGKISLCKAVILGDLVKVQKLLRAAISPDFFIDGRYRETTHLCKHFKECGYDLEDCENEFGQFNSWCSPLMLAVAHKRLTVLQLLVKEGADVELEDHDLKETVIFKALYCCVQEDMLDFLLSCNLNLSHQNYYGQTPIMKACAMSRHDPRYFEIIAKLLQKGVDVKQVDFQGKTLLHYVDEIHTGWLSTIDDDAAEEDCENRHNCANFFSMLENAGGGGCVNVRDKRGEIPLHKAMASGCSEAVLWLIDKGSEMYVKDQDNMTPLLNLPLSVNCTAFAQIIQQFCQSGHLGDQSITGETLLSGCCDLATERENLKLLVENGLDINHQDKGGDTALIGLSAYGHDGTRATRIMRWLVELGADVNHQNSKKECAMYLALRAQHEYKVKFLLQQPQIKLSRVTIVGHTLWHICTISSKMSSMVLPALVSGDVPGINACDSFGSTPLHWAVFCQNNDAVMFLLKHGADPHILNSRGFSAQSLCRKLSNPHMSSIFETLDKCEDDSCCENCQHWLRPCSSISSEQDDNSSWYEHLKDFHLKDVTQFGEMVLSSKHNGFFCDTDENKRLTEDIFSLVKGWVEAIVEDDSLFRNTIELRGSMSEGTKCSMPDEIDIVVYLDNFGKAFTPEVRDDIPKGYVLLRLVDPKDEGTYQKFLNHEYLDNSLLTEYLYSLIERRMLLCLAEPQDKLGLSRSISFGRLSLTSFALFWDGPLYKSLRVSVDIVPAIQTKWLPETKNTFQCSLLKNLSENRGMSTIVLKSPSKEEQFTRRSVVFRITTQAFELDVFKNVHVSFHKAYILCKALLNHSPFVDNVKSWRRYYSNDGDYTVCPSGYAIDDIKLSLEVEDNNFPHVIVIDPDVGQDGVVSTYCLKMAFIYALDKLLGCDAINHHEECPSNYVNRLALMTCQVLEKSFSQSSLEHPILPGVDLLRDDIGINSFQMPILACTVQKVKLLMTVLSDCKVECYSRSESRVKCYSRS